MNNSQVESPLAGWLRERMEGLYANSRQVGALLLLVGAGGSYWSHWSLLRRAHTHAPVAGLSGAFALAVTIAVLGFMCVLGGQRTMDTLRRKGLGWVRYLAFLTVCVVIPCFLALLYMRHELTLLGYE
jgi:hypothetical protein